MTGLPKEDWSDLTALPPGPDRSAGIAELVPSRRRAGRAETPRLRVTERGREAEGGDRAARAKTDRVAITLYLSAELHRRFKSYRIKRGRTNASVVLEAIEARADTLEAVVAAGRVSTSVVTGTLFAPRPGEVRYVGSGPEQVQAWMTGDELDVLAGLSETLGVGTRSGWIAVVLDDFLPGKKTRRG